MLSDQQNDIDTILKYIPHRYPFLLLDKITDFKSGESLTALKNVTINEPFFQGHFPIKPIMPGVLILESMAQASGVFLIKNRGLACKENALYYLVSIDKAKFKKPVVPGDQIIIDVKFKRVIREIHMFDCIAKVDGKTVCSASIMCAEREIDK